MLGSLEDASRGCLSRRSFPLTVDDGLEQRVARAPEAGAAQAGAGARGDLMVGVARGMQQRQVVVVPAWGRSGSREERRWHAAREQPAFPQAAPRVQSGSAKQRLRRRTAPHRTRSSTAARRARSAAAPAPPPARQTRARGGGWCGSGGAPPPAASERGGQARQGKSRGGVVNRCLAGQSGSRQPDAGTPAAPCAQPASPQRRPTFHRAVDRARRASSSRSCPWGLCSSRPPAEEGKAGAHKGAPLASGTGAPERCRRGAAPLPAEALNKAAARAAHTPGLERQGALS